MSDSNVIIDPKTFFVEGPLTLDPSAKSTQPKQFDTTHVKTMVVANGATMLVYDVTNPASPVLVGTIG